MSLLSSSVSVTRYRVDGKLEAPVLETIRNGLTGNIFQENEEVQTEPVSGWTSFENPFVPDFEGSAFVIGSYLVFSLRLDKKSIPAKIVKKHLAVEMARQLENSQRQFLTRDEKQAIYDHVIQILARRIPATPHVYNLIWNLEASWLWFFTNLKAANEALETLFIKSFNLSLIRLFPYTAADLAAGLAEAERDLLLKITPAKFTE
jgi:DNA recombination-dependent growth factor C